MQKYPDDQTCEKSNFWTLSFLMQVGQDSISTLKIV